MPALVPVLALARRLRQQVRGRRRPARPEGRAKREVDGLRESVARLETRRARAPARRRRRSRSTTRLLRDLISAQLPFDDGRRPLPPRLTEAEAQFRGSPIVRLRGALNSKKRPDLAAAVNVIGALEDIQVEPSIVDPQAKIAVDHLGIEKAAGIEQLLSGSTMDEVARMVRLQIKDKLPPIQIPVKVQQSIDLPAVTDGSGADRRREDAPPGGGVPGARRAGAALDRRALPARRPREDGRRAGGGRRERRRRRRSASARTTTAGQAGKPAAKGEGEVTMRARSAVAALAASSVARRPPWPAAERTGEPPTSSAPRSQALEKERDSLRAADGRADRQGPARRRPCPTRPCGSACPPRSPAT